MNYLKKFESGSLASCFEDIKDAFASVSDDWDVNFYYSSAYNGWQGVPYYLRMISVFNGSFRSAIIIEILCKEKVYDLGNEYSISEVLDSSKGHSEMSDIFKLSGEAFLRLNIDINSIKIDCRRSYSNKIIIVIGVMAVL